MRLLVEALARIARHPALLTAALASAASLAVLAFLIDHLIAG